jgi:hypothetical protein
MIKNKLTHTNLVLLRLDAAGVMALYLSQADYNTSELIKHIHHTSTLLREDFLINNGTAITNPNETVLDNATGDGYIVTNNNIPVNESTLVNILYNHPMDNKQLLIYDQPVQGAASSMTVKLSTLLVSSFLALACIILP